MARTHGPHHEGIDRRTLLKAGGAAAGGFALSAFAAPAAVARTNAAAPAAASGSVAAQIRTTVGAPFLQTLTLWSLDGGAESHRIPGLLILASGTVLAAAEHRWMDGDGDPHQLVLKRSVDGGTAWSAQAVIEPTPTTESWVNPTLLQDRDSERVFLFYNGNDGSTYGIFYRYSDDDGLTWSSRVNITSLYVGNPYDWVSYGPGPGHGLQLSSGRLLMQVWGRKHKSIEPPEARGYGLSVIYSDDGGLTWQLGGFAPLDPAFPAGETRMIERADGVVVHEARYAIAGTHSRIVTASTDQGLTWAPLEFLPGIPAAPGVDVGFERMTTGGTPRVLCTWLNSTTKSHLTLSVSYDEGVTFPVSKLINAGNSGYSDIQVRADGMILVIYEAGRELKLSMFNLEWLTDGLDSIATGPGIERLVWQAEDQMITSNRPASAITTVADPLSFSGERIEFAATAAGDYIQFPVTVSTAGNYELAARCVKRGDRGQFQLSVDGTPIGTVKDARSAARAHPLYPAGTLPLTAGTHTIRLTVPGTAGFKLGLDYVQLIKR